MARFGDLGKPRRYVDGIADHGETRLLARAGDDDLAGVDADMQAGKVDTILARCLTLGVARQCEAGPYRPLRIVLVAGGHAEEGHKTVAHYLWHGSAVVFDDQPQLGDPRPDRPEDFLRVEALRQRCVAGQVGE